MAKTIHVTEAEVMAAQLIVKRAKRGIGHASPAVIAIANAKRRGESSAGESSPAEERPAV
jgi:hypothetical protein